MIIMSKEKLKWRQRVSVFIFAVNVGSVHVSFGNLEIHVKNLFVEISWTVVVVAERDSLEVGVGPLQVSRIVIFYRLDETRVPPLRDIWATSVGGRPC